MRTSRWSLLLALCASQGLAAATTLPPRSSDDLINPHKGWMLWGTTFALDGGIDNFHDARIFHVYAPWREIEISDQVFDWQGFEQHHLLPILADYPDATFVLRLVADYPDGPASGVNGWYAGGDPNRDYPLFLEQAPLNIPATNYASCDGDGPGRAPDWNHPEFAIQATQLVQAMAARYEGDPRITAIQVGLLGLWGEWHQSGCEALAPGDSIKTQLRSSYAANFVQTRLQTRYARVPDAQGIEIGFHEDYFPSFTGFCSEYSPPLPLCDDGGDWNLAWGMANQTPESLDNWRTQPLSGESPLTSQKNVWISRSADIENLLRTYHFSFLGPAGKHEQSGNSATLAQLRRALGYNLHLDRVDISPLAAGEAVSVSAEIGNSGSAPPYHRPQLQLALVDGNQAIVWSGKFSGDLISALPGVALQLADSFVLPANLTPGSYALRAALVDRNAGRPDTLLQSSPRDSLGRVALGQATVAAAGFSFADGFED